MQSLCLGNYFFLYPAGHLGLTAVTFLVTLPLMQVIVIFCVVATGVAFADGDAPGLDGGVTAGFVEKIIFTPISLAENVKPLV